MMPDGPAGRFRPGDDGSRRDDLPPEAAALQQLPACDRLRRIRAAAHPEAFPGAEGSGSHGRTAMASPIGSSATAQVWLVRRPAKGLLGGMAALPGGEWTRNAAGEPRPSAPCATSSPISRSTCTSCPRPSRSARAGGSRSRLARRRPADALPPRRRKLRVATPEATCGLSLSSRDLASTAPTLCEARPRQARRARERGKMRASCWWSDGLPAMDADGRLAMAGGRRTPTLFLGLRRRARRAFRAIGRAGSDRAFSVLPLDRLSSMQHEAPLCSPRR